MADRAMTPKITAAFFCRDLTLDAYTGEFTAWKVIHSYRPAIDPRPGVKWHRQDNLWFVLIVTGLPTWPEGVEHLDQDLEARHRFKVRAYSVDARFVVDSVLHLEAQGPNGWGATQVSFSLPIDAPGPLRVEVEHGGAILAETAIELLPLEVDPVDPWTQR